MKFYIGIFIGLAMIGGGSAFSQIPTQATKLNRSPTSSTDAGGFVSFYGSHYKIRTATNLCSVGNFKDHGQTVELCVDNYGRPIPTP